MLTFLLLNSNIYILLNSNYLLVMVRRIKVEKAEASIGK